MSPIDSILSKIHPARVRVFSDPVLCGNARDVRSDRQVYHEVGKSSANRRNFHLVTNGLEDLRFRIPRQSRTDVEKGFEILAVN